MKMTYWKRVVVLTSALLVVATTGFATSQTPDEKEQAGGAAVRTGEFGEAPMLAALVQSGDLPSVTERLPENPSVAYMMEGVGKYGGTVQVFSLDNTPWNTMTEAIERGHYLLQLMPDGSVKGDLAEDWTQSADGKTLTLSLREGTKWSDGEPFTAADIVFTYEDLSWNKDVPRGAALGEISRIRAIDDYTVRIESDNPAFTLPIRLAQWTGGSWQNFFPKHYLMKYHIDYNSDANKLAAEEGFDSWTQAIAFHYEWNPGNDLDMPTMQAWIYSSSTTVRKTFERNPYYWRVDTAGNQLPYIDHIDADIVDAGVYQLNIISGEADLAYVGTAFNDYTLYKSSERDGDYRVVALPNIVVGGGLTFGINQNHSDPVTRAINSDVRYRRALSLAINRDEINDVVYFGLGVPRQYTVTPDAMYYKEEWGEAYAEYDPDRANQLLDEMGLTGRDSGGFRRRSDGQTLQVVVEYLSEAFSQPLELVKEYWEEIGIKVTLRFEDGGLFGQRTYALDHGIMAANGAAAGEIGNYINTAEFWRPAGSEFAWGPAWELWIAADSAIKDGRATLDDYGGAMPGEEPPQDVKNIVQWIIDRGRVPFGSQEYIEISQKIYDLHAELLYMIGTVAMTPWVATVKNGIGNFPSPEQFGGGYYHALHINWFADQFYWK